VEGINQEGPGNGVSRKSVLVVSTFRSTCFAAGMIGLGYGLGLDSVWLAGLLLLAFSGGVVWGETALLILRGVSLDRILKVLAVATIVVVGIEILALLSLRSDIFILSEFLVYPFAFASQFYAVRQFKRQRVTTPSEAPK
jgi:hypothetical protein